MIKTQLPKTHENGHPGRPVCQVTAISRTGQVVSPVQTSLEQDRSTQPHVMEKNINLEIEDPAPNAGSVTD